jgi:hypothetical protein
VAQPKFPLQGELALTMHLGKIWVASGAAAHDTVPYVIVPAELVRRLNSRCKPAGVPPYLMVLRRHEIVCDCEGVQLSGPVRRGVKEFCIPNRFEQPGSWGWDVQTQAVVSSILRCFTPPFRSSAAAAAQVVGAVAPRVAGGVCSVAGVEACVPPNLRGWQHAGSMPPAQAAGSWLCVKRCVKVGAGARPCRVVLFPVG